MAGMFDSQTLSSSSGSIKHLQSTHKEKIYRSFKGSGVSTLVNILHHIINYCGEISNLKAVTSFGWKTFFNKICQQRLVEASDDGAWRSQTFPSGMLECCHKLDGSEQSERDGTFQMDIKIGAKAFGNRFFFFFLNSFLSFHE